MAYFDELNSIVNIIIGDYMLKNQNLCKLLYYFPEETDYSYNPYSEPDIEDTSKLLLTHIYPMPKMPDAKLDQKAYICVTLTGGHEVENNKGFRQINVQFDIICRLEEWLIREGCRVYSVASEIDQMFNDQITTLPIFSNVLYYGVRMTDYSNYYYGLNLIYTMYVNNTVKCDPIPIHQRMPNLGKIET